MTDKGLFFKAVAELTGEFSVLFAGLAIFTCIYNKSNGQDADHDDFVLLKRSHFIRQSG